MGHAHMPYKTWLLEVVDLLAHNLHSIYPPELPPLPVDVMVLFKQMQPMVGCLPAFLQGASPDPDPGTCLFCSLDMG
jgi:hypothetical protein